MRYHRLVHTLAGLAIVAGTAGAQDAPRPAPGPGGTSAPNADPFPSTYQRVPSRPTVIRNVRIFTGAGPLIENGAIVLQDGKITAVGGSLPPEKTAGARIVPVAGKGYGLALRGGIAAVNLDDERIRRQAEQQIQPSQRITYSLRGEAQVRGRLSVGANDELWLDVDGLSEKTERFRVPLEGAHNALNLLGARRISIASPYEEWLNEKLRVFMEKNGFDVVAIKGLSTQAHASVPLSDIEALVHSVNRPETEAIFVSCTDFRTLGIIEKLERKLGKPVVNSNQAVLWAALKRLSAKLGSARPAPTSPA